MNSTSLGEVGGSLGRVDGGSLRVGWPGAPGCTMTGDAGSVCCAQTGNETEAAKILTAATNAPFTGLALTLR